LRNAPNKPDSPSQALIDYFSVHKDTRAFQEYESIKIEVDALVSGISVKKLENLNLENEIIKMKQ